MPKTWRIIDLIHWAESYFKDKGFENPRGEIEWLLRAVLNCSRMDVYLRFEEPVSRSQLDTLRAYVKRRLEKEPLQYITGSCEFYGRDFLVNNHVLIPRPETERLVDIALDKLNDRNSLSILDVGTGSGCIAITLGLEKPDSIILGLDISAEALNQATLNKDKNSAKNVSFQESNFLNDLPDGPFDLVVSNPPYIPENEIAELMKDVKDFEPNIALTDKQDGLTFYKRFADVGKSLVKKDGFLILEVGLGNHPQNAESIFEETGYKQVELIKDYNGDDRVLVIQV